MVTDNDTYMLSTPNSFSVGLGALSPLKYHPKKRPLRSIKSFAERETGRVDKKQDPEVDPPWAKKSFSPGGFLLSGGENQFASETGVRWTNRETVGSKAVRESQICYRFYDFLDKLNWIVRLSSVNMSPLLWKPNICESVEVPISSHPLLNSLLSERGLILV